MRFIWQHLTLGSIFGDGYQRKCWKGQGFYDILYLKGAVKKTSIEYTQASSLHGVQYIFEGGRRLKASRVLWLGLALAAAILGIIWSAEVGCFDFSTSKFQDMIIATFP